MEKKKLFLVIGIGVLIILITMGVSTWISTPVYQAKKAFVKQLEETTEVIKIVDAEVSLTFESVDSLKVVLLTSVMNFKQSHLDYLKLIDNPNKLYKYNTDICYIDCMYPLVEISLSLKSIGLSIDELEGTFTQNNIRHYVEN